MHIISRPKIKWVFTLALLGSSQSGFAVPELLINGNFGGFNNAGVATPSMAGWVVTNNGANTSDIKIYDKDAGCSAQQCSGVQKAVFQCGQVLASDPWFNTEILQTLPSKLKPNTRYRLSYSMFTDITTPLVKSAQAVGGVSIMLLPVGSEGYAVMHGLQMFPKFASLATNDVAALLAQPTVEEFVTPDDAATMNRTVQLNFYLTKSDPSVSSRACVGNLSLTEVAAPSSAPIRVAVNGVGYAVNGPKIATLVLPTGTTSTAAYRWRLMQGNTPASMKSDVSRVVTKKIFGKIVSTSTSNSSSDAKYLTTLGNASRDPDSGDIAVVLDFSGFTTTPVTSVSTIRTGSSLQSTTTVTTTSITANITPEDYWIQVTDAADAELTRSPKFRLIGQGGWEYGSNDRIRVDALAALKSQRSGAAVPYFVSGNNLRGYNFHDVVPHAASHSPDMATCWFGTDGMGLESSKDLHGNDWGNGGSGCVDGTGKRKTFDVTGGWYDAADHGKYVVNGGIALWTLQNQIERMQGRGSFANQNTINALLAEARHEMSWMLKMQVPAGMRMKVPLGYQDKIQAVSAITPNYGPTGAVGMYQVDLAGQPMAPTAQGAVAFGGGQIPRLRMKVSLSEVDVGDMVFHAVHDQNWTAIPLDPSKDTQPRVLMYPTTAATLNFAAVAAQCSRVFKTVDPAFANQCLAAAKKAWTKAQQFRTGFTDGLGNVVPAKSDILRYEFSNMNWSA
ncbi:MAG: glycoside hydrolase family 9 protein, partial [Pseudomonadota bacterium]